MIQPIAHNIKTNTKNHIITCIQHFSSKKRTNKPFGLSMFTYCYILNQSHIQLSQHTDRTLPSIYAPCAHSFRFVSDAPPLHRLRSVLDLRSVHSVFVVFRFAVRFKFACACLFAVSYYFFISFSLSLEYLSLYVCR